MTTNKTIFVKTAERELLEHELRQLEVGQEITYEALARSVGISVEEVKVISYRARQFLECQERIVIRPIPGVGLKRLDSPDVVDSTDEVVVRARRASKRASRRLVQCVEYDELDQDKKVKHNVRLAQLGSITLLSDKKSEKRLTEHVKEAGEKPSLKNTLDLLGEGDEDPKPR
jgi:hypothetical protein